MGWITLATAGLELVRQVLTRRWGTETRAQATQEETIDEAEAAFRDALRMGNLPAANAAIDRLWELRNKAAATRAK